MKEQQMIKTSLIIIVLSATLSFSAETWYTVTRIIDGDTLVIKTDDGEEKVRLYGIDTPERGEAGYFVAAGELETLCLNKKIRLEYPEKKKRDNFGRLLAKIYTTDGKLINQLMLDKGLAKLYKKSPLKKEDNKNADLANLESWDGFEDVSTLTDSERDELLLYIRKAFSKKYGKNLMELPVELSKNERLTGAWDIDNQKRICIFDKKADGEGKYYISILMTKESKTKGGK